MIRGPFAILLQILAEGGSPRGHPSASNTPKPAHPLLPCRRRPLARLVVTVFASVVVRQETHAFLPTGELKSANSGKTMHVSRARVTPSSAQPKSIEIVATARQSYLNAIQYEYCRRRCYRTLVTRIGASASGQSRNAFLGYCINFCRRRYPS